MKRFLTVAGMTGLVALAMTGVAQAQVETYEFDKGHTQILFFADHLGFSKSQGEFHDYYGEFVIDRANPENSRVNVTIQTDSIDMDMERWDEHMKNEDFFNVEEYPTMTFESTEVTMTEEDMAEVTGNLTLLGETHPVTLDVTHNKSGKHPFNDEYVAGFSATTTIDRSKWGMDYGLPLMSPDVDIRIEVEGYRQGNPEAEDAGN